MARNTNAGTSLEVQNALVTGGAGFLGRHVARAIADRGANVVTLDDLSCVNSAFDLPELTHPRIRRIHGSMFDRRLVEALVSECDTIVHFASVVGVEETIANPVLTIRNLEGTLGLCESLTERHSVIFGSSADVYGLRSLINDAPMREDDLHVYEDSSVNRWVYPKVKSLEENLVANSAASSVVVRIFNSYGPFMDYPVCKRVVPQFITRLIERAPLQVSGDGRQTRALCYYEDTVRGILLAIEFAKKHPAPSSVTVNVGSTEVIAMIDLADVLGRLAIELDLIEDVPRIDLVDELYSRPFNDTWNRVPDLTRARELIGYRPAVCLEDGLRLTLESYRFAFHSPPRAQAPRRSVPRISVA